MGKPVQLKIRLKVVRSPFVTIPVVPGNGRRKLFVWEQMSSSFVRKRRVEKALSFAVLNKFALSFDRTIWKTTGAFILFLVCATRTVELLIGGQSLRGTVLGACVVIVVISSLSEEQYYVSIHNTRSERA
ncbi:hypothetical protein AVEN_112114-1 [Araneus ventricosus]|uniref:Uncharacterized protein n=1 Tax=Araneus ventricosus TaxID=182803 RepID=A0A4Y2FQL1_ARAVE|nr:hypothetical protein AVEN_112114-1 [Araneus ventricosus]